ncbi:hypothetical protein F5B20DRAFT_589912 [Whalleya microplaca]|nr:hypothetical protein F5B20DRAFT_589912 [Whalleya microplaca]
MNWTEGNLSRHSRGRKRNALLTRQKQHFAKARNNLLGGGIKQSPRSLSFFGINHSQDLEHRGSMASAPYTALSSPLEVIKWERKKPPDSHFNTKALSSAIHEKRRKLLEKSDWVGLNMQQPIEIKFPGQLQAASNSRWGKLHHPQDNMARKRQGHIDWHQSQKSGHAHVHPIRIQIGSQEVQPSANTASSLDTRRYSLAPGYSKPSQISKSPPSESRHPYVTSENKQTLQGLNSHSHSQPREYAREQLKASPKFQLPEEPVHVVYSSSVIQEPAPRRADDFVVLQWSPSVSESGDSMQVEIERPARPVPPSEEGDQEKWKNWVLNLSDDLSKDLPFSKSSSDKMTPSIIASVRSRASVSPSSLQKALQSREVSNKVDINTSNQPPKEKLVDQEGERPAVKGSNYQSPKPVYDRLQEVQSAEDDNKAWLKFVFNEKPSDEIEKEAFEEAAHEIACELRPSISSASIDQATETAATCGSDCFSKDEEEKSQATFTGTSTETQMVTEGTNPSELGLSDIATAGSTNIDESESRFRFAPPRTFVGKFADPEDVARIQTHSLPHVKGTDGKQKRRRKKRALDGRTDIRCLPDFDGDPIEEFED